MPSMMPAIDFLFSEEFLSAANPYLLQAEIAAAVLLGLGIVFESDKYPRSVHKSAFWYVVIGVVLETVFSVLLFTSEERISSLQKATIIALEVANLDRNMTKGQAKSLAAFATKYSGTSASVFSAKDIEANAFAVSIAKSLRSGGWAIPPTQALRSDSIPFVLGGVMVVGNTDDKSKEMARELVKEMHSLGFCAGIPESGFPLQSLAQHPITVIVGTKLRQLDSPCQ
jgi:hypothetical protein